MRHVAGKLWTWRVTTIYVLVVFVLILGVQLGQWTDVVWIMVAALGVIDIWLIVELIMYWKRRQALLGNPSGRSIDRFLRHHVYGLGGAVAVLLAAGVAVVLTFINKDPIETQDSLTAIVAGLAFVSAFVGLGSFTDFHVGEYHRAQERKRNDE